MLKLNFFPSMTTVDRVDYAGLFVQQRLRHKQAVEGQEAIEPGADYCFDHARRGVAIARLIQ